VAQGIRRLAVGSGATSILGRVFGGIGVILMFHRVRPTTWTADPGASVTPETFLAIVHYLRSTGYEIATLDEGLARLEAGKPRFACLTFDDGYQDNHHVLWSLVQQERVPVTIYLTTGYVSGTYPAWWLLLEALIATRPSLSIDGTVISIVTAPEKTACYAALTKRVPSSPEDARHRVMAWIAQQNVEIAELQRDLFMNWTMIQEMNADPLIVFGGHTVSHPRLATLSNEAAQREIETCRDDLREVLGKPPRHFAYPFGQSADSGTREADLVRRAGFVSAVRAYGGPVRRGCGAMNLPRIPIGGDDGTTDLAIRMSGVKSILQAV